MKRLKGQIPKHARREGEWKRTAAMIGILCLLFNAVAGSSHAQRMAVATSGNDAFTIICTSSGPVSVPTATLFDTEPGSPIPAKGEPFQDCVFCAFSNTANCALLNCQQPLSEPGLHGRTTLAIPENQRLLNDAAPSGVLARAPPATV